MAKANCEYREGDFPWLPGQAHVTPNPAYSFKEHGEAPAWLMLTLNALASRADPAGLPPKSWLNAITADRHCVEAMRAFGRECFNVLDLGDGPSPEWYAWNGDGVAAERLSDRDAWWRIWSGHCRLLLADLNEAQENVDAALDRIPKQWAAYVARRSRAFWTHYEDASVWPPRLALVWIMYGGNRDAVCAYFDGSVDRSKRPDLLDWIGLSLEDDTAVVNSKPVDVLAVSMRRSASHHERVKVKGLVEGEALLSTIDPDDLARLHWLSQENAGFDATAILVPAEYSSTNRLPIVSNVVIDRESLWHVFPPSKAQVLTTNALPKIAKPSRFAVENRNLAEQRIRSRGEEPKSDALVAELMQLYEAAGGRQSVLPSSWARYLREAT